MNFIYLFIFFICLTIVFKHMENKTFDVVYVTANNKKDYLVRNLPDKEKAATLLGNMNDKLDELIDYIRTKDVFNMYKMYVVRNNEIELEKLSKTQKKEYQTFKEDIKRIVKNYNSDALSENTPDSSYTSYSENKGQKIVFCLRSKKTNKLVDLNTMLFVALHEMAHLMTKSIGHLPEFWENFRILLRIAIRNGIYQCQDYQIESEDYCGTKITDTPLKCGDV